VRRITTFTELGFERIAAKFGSSNLYPARAYPSLLISLLRREGIVGKIGIYGRNDLSSSIQLVDELRRLGLMVSGEKSPTVLESVRETKSPREIDELRRVGTQTSRVVRSIIETLRNMNRKRGRLYFGRRLATIDVLKRRISQDLAAENLTTPEGTIFAIGASGADPHNAGNPRDRIKVGRLIVFDIFPQGETGYWFDLTRSFILGRADRRAKKMFDAVLEAQNSSLDFLREGVTGEEVMERACHAIEQGGFRTVREIYEGRARSVSSGFNHSLGHGVGLTIGERPYLSFLSKTPLRAGHVVTVEPGVYLPRYGGVRIEDTVLVTSKGVENLARVDKELEIA
jgi:Xaa-Pro aminopeptidase